VAGLLNWSEAREASAAPGLRSDSILGAEDIVIGFQGGEDFHSFNAPLGRAILLRVDERELLVGGNDVSGEDDFLIRNEDL
jgi:hypothetical protein